MLSPSPPADLLTEYRRGLLQTYVDQARQLHDQMAACGEGSVHEAIEAGGWSPHQVVWHVRAADLQAYLPRLRRLLEGDRLILDDFDGEGWMRDHYEPDEAWPRIVAELQQARRAMGLRLGEAEPAAWSHVGRHSYWGERSLMWWVERSVAHVGEHLDQLSNRTRRAA
jgi:hypothetical protein